MARVLLTLLIAVGLLQTEIQSQITSRLHPRRIAVFGSSVANGTGDEFNREGYTGMLRTMLAARGWEVLNQSRGGDTTQRLAERWAPAGAGDTSVRYLVPVRPSYVIIGLSFGNEGLFEAESKAGKEAIMEQYLTGIRGFVDRARKEGMVPVVSLAYPRAVYSTTDYEYMRRANVIQQQWDVPSVNVLGAVDDGTGRWARGFEFDDKHPNAAGHKEFLYSYVPSLFEALEAGKPTPVKPVEGSGFARVSNRISPLTFSPQETMHSFSLSFMVRTQGNGSVAAINGSVLDAKTEIKTVARGALQFSSTALTPGQAFTSTIRINGRQLSYVSSTGDMVSSTLDEAPWHHIVLSHYGARGETLFFVDGRLAGKVVERLEPTRFVIGGPGTLDQPAAPARADYKEVFLFRAGLNIDEAAALYEGKILQGSLEIYAPLADQTFRLGTLVENRAQSMSAFYVGSDTLVHVPESQAR